MMTPGSDWSYQSNKRLILAVMLELAHAIARGRKPSSCSFIPGKNVKAYLKEVCVDIDSHSFDLFGDKCPKIEMILIDLYAYQSEEDMTMIRAIELVERRLLPPKKKPEDFRGDPDYQKRNPKSRLNRKRERERWLKALEEKPIDVSHDTDDWREAA